MIPSRRQPQLHYRITAFSAKDEGLQQYFLLRHETFRKFGMDYYRPAPDVYDRQPSTRFILLEDKQGNVLGGRRILIHQPRSATRLKTEDTVALSLRAMLPHLDLDALRYAELTSLALADATRGLGIGQEIYDVTFDFCRDEQVDFIVGEVVPTNIRGFIEAAKRGGAKQIMPRPDQRSIDGDEDFRLFVSFHGPEILQLRSAEMIRDGLGLPLSDEAIGEMIARREKLKIIRRFTTRDYTLQNLAEIHDRIQTASVKAPHPKGGEVEIPAVLHLKGNGKKPQMPFMLFTQIHGNEPAGLTAQAMAIALDEAGLLDAPVYCVIGNPFAAKQYFEAYRKNGKLPENSRDDFRAGVNTKGELQKDLNRIPRHVWELDPATDYHTARAQQLDALAQISCGILDIHSARGDLPCVTNYSDLAMLKRTPIPNILEGLLEAIANHTANVTFKQLISRHSNIVHSYGIEAGQHEDPKSFPLAAAFTLALFYNLGLTMVSYNGKLPKQYYAYHVGKSLPFSGLVMEGKPVAEDLFETTHQFGELEEITQGQLIATADKSGAKLLSPRLMHSLFPAKYKKFYRDPTAGIIPFSPAEMDKKFCYPCTREPLDL